MKKAKQSYTVILRFSWRTSIERPAAMFKTLLKITRWSVENFTPWRFIEAECPGVLEPGSTVSFKTKSH